MSFNKGPLLFMWFVVKFSLSVVDGSEDSWTEDGDPLCFHFLNSIKKI